LWVLGFLRLLLLWGGLRGGAARHPADAVQWFALEPERFDVVLSDHTMPGMTGLELARTVLARRPDVPVLLYSGRSELLNANTVAAAGVRRLLAKPVDGDDLHAALQDALVGAPA
jgi:CheY-like chemotaxis protein